MGCNARTQVLTDENGTPIRVEKSLVFTQKTNTQGATRPHYEQFVSGTAQVVRLRREKTFDFKRAAYAAPLQEPLTRRDAPRSGRPLAAFLRSRKLVVCFFLCLGIIGLLPEFPTYRTSAYRSWKKPRKIGLVGSRWLAAVPETLAFRIIGFDRAPPASVSRKYRGSTFHRSDQFSPDRFSLHPLYKTP